MTEAELLRDDFRTIAEAMPQLVWTASGDGKIDYFNQRWIDYTGVDLDEFRRRGEYVGVVHADDVDETWKRWTEAIESGTPYEQEFRLRRGADGGYRWFLCRAVPLFARDGKVSRWIGTSTDVDEGKRARDSLSFMVQAGSVFSAPIEVDEICKGLARVAIERFADWCFVTLAEGGAYDTIALEHRDRDRVAFVQQYRDRYPPRPGDALARAIQENRPALFERITGEQLAAGARDEEHLRVLRSLEMRSGMVLPLATLEGKVFGAVTMISAESGRLFDRNDLEVAGRDRRTRRDGDRQRSHAQGRTAHRRATALYQPRQQAALREFGSLEDDGSRRKDDRAGNRRCGRDSSRAGRRAAYRSHRSSQTKDQRDRRSAARETDAAPRARARLYRAAETP